MVICAIDPSFNALSTSIFNVDTKKVYLNTISESLGENIGFDKVFRASRSLRDKHIQYIKKLIDDKKIPEITEVFSEVAPPTAAFSSGLFALDTLVLSDMFDTFSSIERIYSIPPSFVSTVHGTNRYNKGQSTQLAKYYIDEVLHNDLEVIIPDTVSQSGRRLRGRLNNDKAESFLFLLRAIVKYDIHGLRNKIMSEMSGLGYEAEKMLIQRT